MNVADGFASLLIVSIGWLIAGWYVSSDLVLAFGGALLSVALIGIGVFSE